MHLLQTLDATFGKTRLFTQKRLLELKHQVWGTNFPSIRDYSLTLLPFGLVAEHCPAAWRRDTNSNPFLAKALLVWINTAHHFGWEPTL